MRELWTLTHSPRHLLVFEAAARLKSFTLAAEELNVSQPAVSLTVRQLESALGLRLFVRGHRSITLTRAGEVLFGEVTAGFTRILEAARQLGRQSRKSHVTLSVSTAFANYWMVPRLQRFHRDNPDIDLRLQTSEKDLELDEEGLDLGVRRGSGDWLGYEATRIAEEILLPVASPQFAARLAPDPNLSDLADQILIHLEEPFRPRPTWKDWFAGLGRHYVDSGGGLRLNDYALVLQAAMAGEGIAMGWQHVTEGLIKQGLLVEVGPWVWRTGQGFYIVRSQQATASQEAERVYTWLVADARGQAVETVS